MLRVAVLQKFGIADKKKERVYSLSGGQRQRVVIARAIIIVTHDPEVAGAFEKSFFLDRGVLSEECTSK